MKKLSLFVILVLGCGWCSLLNAAGNEQPLVAIQAQQVKVSTSTESQQVKTDTRSLWDFGYHLMNVILCNIQ